MDREVYRHLPLITKDPWRFISEDQWNIQYMKGKDDFFIERHYAFYFDFNIMIMFVGFSYRIFVGITALHKSKPF